MDGSVRVKIDFYDGTNISLTRSVFDKDHDALAGVFSFVGGGDYGHNYELTLLRTKSITKVGISGDYIDNTTYIVDELESLDFMQGINCLFNLLK